MAERNPGNAAGVASSPTLPTALQQRLDWKPVVGMAFRHRRDFSALLDVYSFTTGKRYENKGSRDHEDNRKEINFYCKNCKRGKRGLIRLCILRRNQSLSWWIVRKVRKCGCGQPTPLLADLKVGGRMALEGKRLPSRKEWSLLANACFPAGYKNARTRERLWRISCRRPRCPGQMEVHSSWESGGFGYNGEYALASVSDCSPECKAAGSHGSPVAMATWTALPENTSCPLCCQEDLKEWVLFPCGKETCLDCLRKLVQSCPAAIVLHSTLEIFDPANNKEHCHTCPFCKVSYHPWTKVRHRTVNSSGVASTLEVEVRSLVPVPYAYQSFSKSRASHLATSEEFPEMSRLYDVFRAKKLAEATRESASSIEDVFSFADAISDEDFGRLHLLKQSDHFRCHPHEVLNFLDAVEALHDRHLDSGFLQRVADANGTQERAHLMSNAYSLGWNRRPHELHDSLIVNLLERKGLLEVINLVSESEGYDSRTGIVMYDSENDNEMESVNV